MPGKLREFKQIHKSGNKNKAANYRPISLLIIPSKILEKAVHINFYNFLITNQKLCDNQFGFRPGLSCEIALLCLIELLANNADKGRVNGVAFVDLRKAFDSGGSRICEKGGGGGPGIQIPENIPEKRPKIHKIGQKTKIGRKRAPPPPLDPPLFDAVVHDVLLHKLSVSGCSEHAVKWFHSYLTEGSHFVSIKGEASNN